MPFHPVVDPDFVGPLPEPSLLDSIINGIGQFVEGVQTVVATVGTVSGILTPEEAVLTPPIVDPGRFGPSVDIAPAGRGIGGAGLPLLLVGAVIVAVLFLPR